MLLSFFIKRKRALLYQYLAALQPYIDGVRRIATSHLSLHVWESLCFSDFPDVLDNLILLGINQLNTRKIHPSAKKISFHPIFSAVGKHTNFFEAFRAASRPYFTYASR